MPLSFEKAIILANDYNDLTVMQKAFKLIDDTILNAVIKFRDIKQISIPVITFPIPGNCINWFSLIDAYNREGWDIKRDKERILLTRK